MTIAISYIESLPDASVFDSFIMQVQQLDSMPASYGRGIAVSFSDSSFAIITDAGYATTGHVDDLDQLINVKRTLH